MRFLKAQTLRRAHPRSRGEHRDSRYRAAQQKGSSPLARGALDLITETVHVNGLIPARAGSTYPLAHQSTCRRGSSPLARGALWGGGGKCCCWGLIPARAGSTFQGPCLNASRRAHPRSRGEHRSNSYIADRDEGSSPLARGAPERN